LHHSQYPDGTTIQVSSDVFDWQVSHMALVLSRFSATLFTVVHLDLEAQLGVDHELEDMDDVEWLHLFHQFPAVQTLHVSQQLSRHVAYALDDITGETVAEVLPSLDMICLAGQPASSVKKFGFVAARRLSGRPVTVVNTKEEFYKRFEPYISK
jgi:hypothetical protein